jgi:hypothetical protein
LSGLADLPDEARARTAAVYRHPLAGRPHVVGRDLCFLHGREPADGGDRRIGLAVDAVLTHSRATWLAGRRELQVF